MMKASPQEIFQVLSHRLINFDLEDRFLNPSLMAFSTSLAKSNYQAQTQTAVWSKLPLVIKLEFLLMLKLVALFFCVFKVCSVEKAEIRNFTL